MANGQPYMGLGGYERPDLGLCINQDLYTPRLDSYSLSWHLRCECKGFVFLGWREQVNYILCFLTTSGFACSMYSVSLVLVFNHVFRPVLQLRTISNRFSFLSEWSSVSSLLDSDFWRGICYVIFLFRGPKYIFFITWFQKEINELQIIIHVKGLLY